MKTFVLFFVFLYSGLSLACPDLGIQLKVRGQDFLNEPMVVRANSIWVAGNALTYVRYQASNKWCVSTRDFKADESVTQCGVGSAFLIFNKDQQVIASVDFDDAKATAAIYRIDGNSNSQKRSFEKLVFEDKSDLKTRDDYELNNEEPPKNIWVRTIVSAFDADGKQLGTVEAKKDAMAMVFKSMLPVGAADLKDGAEYVREGGCGSKLVRKPAPQP